MTSRFLFSVIALMMTVSVHAQVYKWIDANGNVTYADTPPPKSVAKVETKSFSSSDQYNVNLPYELAQAVQKMPVTLYTSGQCPVCDEGRTFLKQIGIPFAEKTVTTNADIVKLNNISGGGQLPFLMIGKIKQIGYGASQWRSNLSLAGYPESNILPADYNYPNPQPAAPVVVIQKHPDSTPTPEQSDQPARDPNGFQF